MKTKIIILVIAIAFAVTSSSKQTLAQCAGSGGALKWCLAGNAGTVAGIDFLGTTDAADLVIKTSGIERMRILGAGAGALAGSVGIGTAAPLFPVHISNTNFLHALNVDHVVNTASVNLAAYIKASNSGTGDTWGVYSDLPSPVNGGCLQGGFFANVTNNLAGDSYGAKAYLAGTGNGKQYGFYSSIVNSGTGTRYGVYSSVTGGTGTKYGVYSVASGSSNYAFYGTGRGYFSDKVGIGTNSPGTILEVANSNPNVRISSTNSSGTSCLQFKLAGTTTSRTDWQIKNNDGLYFGLSDDDFVTVTDYAFLTRYQFSPIQDCEMTLGSTGNRWEELWACEANICGVIKAEEVQIETGWCDYVFDKSYSLRPLEEVAAFIAANKHLPNIPAAAEVESNGLKVGDISKRMMEKIEELTLYVIDQNERIKVLENQNMELTAALLKNNH